jgi:hypothetical protein
MINSLFKKLICFRFKYLWQVLIKTSKWWKDPQLLKFYSELLVKELVPKAILEASDEKLQELLDTAVQKQDLNIIKVVFLVPREKPQNLAAEALKKLGTWTFDKILDDFEAANSNWDRWLPRHILKKVGNLAVYRVIERLESYSARNPNRKRLADLLTEITGQKFLFGNSDPKKWWKWWRENLA